MTAKKPQRPPTPADINARNRRHARYQQRLAERVLALDRGPIEVTPEIERALNTSVAELPVDWVARGALRRAEATVKYNWLAHLRLATIRNRNRATQRSKNAARTQKATESHTTRGDASRARVRATALTALKKTPDLTRKALARKIYKSVNLGEHRTVALLKKLKLPSTPRRR